MNFDDPKTPRTKKKVIKTKPRKIPRVTKKTDVKSSASAIYDLEPEQTNEPKKLWVLKDDTIDLNLPTYVFFAKDEISAKSLAKEVGILEPALDVIERRGAYMFSMGERQSGDVEMSDKGQETEDEMSFWISNDHTTLYPYTPGAVIVAKNELDAHRLLKEKLEDLGLHENDKFNIIKLDEEKGYQITGENPII